MEAYRGIDAFFSALPDPVLLVNAHGEIVKLNDIALATLPGVREGACLKEVGSALRWEGVAEFFEECLRAEKAALHLVKDASGRALYEITFIPFFQSGPKPEAMLVQIANVAGEVLMEERFRMLQRVFHSISEGAIVLDAERNVVWMNEGAAALVGMPGERIARLPWERAVRIPDGIALDSLRRGMAAGARLELKTELLRGDGERIACSISLSPLRSEDGRSLGFALILKDRTQEVEMERSLLQMEKLNALGRLVAGFAHELNNPLTSVIGLSQLLMASGRKEAVPEEINLIHSHALRCKKIIDNLLTFARRNTPEKRNAGLGEIAASVVDLFRRPLEREGIRIRFERGDTADWVKADPSQLQQVLVNLLENSRYALARREGAKEIVLTSIVEEPWAVLRVRDTGPGIPKDSMDRLFDPFYTTKPPGEGTGLGLSLSFGILQEHGGTLKARNAPDGGAEFEIRLPRAKDHNESWTESKTQKTAPSQVGGPVMTSR